MVRRQFVTLISTSVLFVTIASGLLFTYASFWAVWYRIPSRPACVIDLRTNWKEPACYVSLCAGLASNPHGFPGHCWVSWSKQWPSFDASTAIDSMGFVPTRPEDQVPSLWKRVAGSKVHNASFGNLRNVDALIVMVNENQFARTLDLRESWKRDGFQVGIADCVCFVDDVAAKLGIRRPSRYYKFPQDYIRELKALNQNNNIR